MLFGKQVVGERLLGARRLGGEVVVLKEKLTKCLWG